MRGRVGTGYGQLLRSKQFGIFSALCANLNLCSQSYGFMQIVLFVKIDYDVLLV